MNFTSDVKKELMKLPCGKEESRAALSAYFSACGVFAAIVKFAEEICPHLRADTHENNAAMRAALIKNGFSERGEIRLADGAARLAYEKNGDE